MPCTVVNWAVETVCTLEMGRLRAVGVALGPPNRSVNFGLWAQNSRKIGQSVNLYCLDWKLLIVTLRMVNHHDGISFCFLGWMLSQPVLPSSWAKLFDVPSMQDDMTGLSNIMSESLAFSLHESWKDRAGNHHEWSTCLFLVCKMTWLGCQTSWVKVSLFLSMKVEMTELSLIMSDPLACS